MTHDPRLGIRGDTKVTDEKDVRDYARVDEQPSSGLVELPQRPTEAVSATAPERKRYRIWTLYCPFKKSGFPAVRNFGSSLNQVVIINITTWNQMCADIPALQTAEFEVGTED